MGMGVLLLRPRALVALAQARPIVFDKTGTLTQGELTLTRIIPARPGQAEDVARLAAALGTASSHPVSRAAARGWGRDDLPEVDDLREIVGFGVTGRIGDDVVAFGRPDLRVQSGLTPPELPAHDGPIAGVGRGRTFLGWLLFADQPRREAPAALADLRRLGLERQMLLTGDRTDVARRIGSQLGIVEIRAEALPEQKMRHVLAEIEAGHLPMVVGDGINDSPALATAVIGIALASGTDVAMEAADIVIMRSDDLLAVPASLSLARTIFNRIKLNLVWACVYNIIGLPFAMGIFLPFGGIALPPMAAGAAMALSSVSVVGSSLLLKFWRRPKWMNAARLEKEAEMGLLHQSRRSQWKENLVYGSAAAFSRLRTVLAKTVFGKGSAQAREEEGYVPLQTVEH
jgi:Cu+-exporting ATPase